MSRENHPPPTRFHRACLGEAVDHVPVWLMRQAGRYMPEYQRLRERVGFLELCLTPELASQATLDAWRFLGTDAAIIFSDIVLPAAAMGQQLAFEPGPVLSPALRTCADVARLRSVDPSVDLAPVLEAIRLTRKALPDAVSLIGFVGAPFTLAAYMVEGRPGHHFAEARRLAYTDPSAMHALLEKVTDAVTAHAAAQVEAGCDALQLFDTLAAELAPPEMQAFAFQYARSALNALRPLGVPIIYFARNLGARLEAAAQLGAHVLALDWTVTVSEARARLGRDVALMGNLDPAVLLGSREQLDRRIDGIMAEARGAPGFIFNLGHGVLPSTPPEMAKHLVARVQGYDANS